VSNTEPQPCGNPRCGREYDNTSSGRHNHRLIHGHAPRPETPKPAVDPFALDREIREREAAERARRTGGAR
jgi:hypothetical protein